MNILLNNPYLIRESRVGYLVTSCVEHGTKIAPDLNSQIIYRRNTLECIHDRAQRITEHAEWHNKLGHECWACCDRMVLAQIGDREPVIEVPHNQMIDGAWVEFEMSACPSGCKIYRDRTTGRFALMHNSLYGCRR